MNIGDEIRKAFSSGTSLTRLILINLGVFVAVKIINVFLFLFQQADLADVIMSYLALPADGPTLLTRPWTLVSYMFLHYSFFHILFNMLWLYWFGRIFLQYLDARKLLSIYLLGGLAGGALYILAFNVFPAFEAVLSSSIALGASAAVLAVVMTISFYVPDYQINLLFIGRIKIKHIALVSIVIDLLSIESGNAGGHIAHLGGALFGIIYAYQIRKGKDMTKGFSRFMDRIFSWFKPRPKLHVKYKRSNKTETDIEYNTRKAAEQKEIDRILDKISKMGYTALTKAEKELLFKSSKK